MRLPRIAQPFDHPDWLYEVKFRRLPRARVQFSGSACEAETSMPLRYGSASLIGAELPLYGKHAGLQHRPTYLDEPKFVTRSRNSLSVQP